MTNGKKSSPVSLLYLPDDLLFNCLARVLRLHYPTLSLVSKRFRALLESHDLYHTRTLLGRTESCLYVCLSFESECYKRWFTLCRRPYRTPTNNIMKKEEKPSDNLLVSFPTRNYSPSYWKTLVAFGSNIYKTGGFVNGFPSSKVFFMDCRSHTWHEAPSMLMGQKYPLTSVLDGKIYVVESYNVQSSSHLIEVFDPKTQIWEVVRSPKTARRWNSFSKSLAIDRKLYLFMGKGMVYKPKETKWAVVRSLETLLGQVSSSSSCVIDNIIYSYGMFGLLEWYDSKATSWRLLKGLENFTKLPNDCECVRLADYGGKTVVMWEENVHDNIPKKTMIWCA